MRYRGGGLERSPGKSTEGLASVNIPAGDLKTRPENPRKAQSKQSDMKSEKEQGFHETDDAEGKNPKQTRNLSEGERRNMRPLISPGRRQVEGGPGPVCTSLTQSCSGRRTAGLFLQVSPRREEPLMCRRTHSSC